MSKKQSLQLKTVDVAQLMSIKTHLPKASKQAANPQSQYKTSIRHKTQNAAKFGNMLKLAKRQEIIRYKIEHLIEEGQKSPIKPCNQKDSLKQFPKREKSIKNSNPYRYFLSSKSQRLPTQNNVINEPVLHLNFTKILKEKFALRFKRNSIENRATTQADILTGNRKNFNRKNCASLKKFDESFTSSLEPWFISEIEEANTHPIPFHKRQ